MSLTKPKNGMFRNFRGVRTIIDQVDEKKYQNLLPDIFKPHETPEIFLFIADYIKVFPWPMTRYQESAVSLKCKYNGEDYWYVYTMPVTKLVPMWGGRRLGFPKYIADEISLKQVGNTWVGRLRHKDQCKMCLTFTPGIDEKSRQAEKSFFLGKIVNLYPPGRGPNVYAVNLKHQVEAEWDPVYGMVKADMEMGKELDGLFDDGIPYVGMYNEFKGGMNLSAYKLTPTLYKKHDK